MSKRPSGTSLGRHLVGAERSRLHRAGLRAGPSAPAGRGGASAPPPVDSAPKVWAGRSRGPAPGPGAGGAAVSPPGSGAGGPGKAFLGVGGAARLCWTGCLRGVWGAGGQSRPGGASAAKSLQSCPTLRDPIAGSPPGSAIPGILQARILEWVAISFSNA